MQERYFNLIRSASLSVILIVLASPIAAKFQASGDDGDGPSEFALKDIQINSVFGSPLPAIDPTDIAIVRHQYLACLSTESHQPRWVSYVVSRHDWDSDNVLSRNFSTPADLRDVCLEQSDYTNSGFELGHLYGLQFVSASQWASEVNQLCVVAAQSPELNKGPWLLAENRIKKLSETEPVTVLAGQLWLNEMPDLANADEPHKVASHCWIWFRNSTADEAYVIPQKCKRSDALEQFAIEPGKLRAKVSSKWIGGE